MKEAIRVAPTTLTFPAQIALRSASSAVVVKNDTVEEAASRAGRLESVLRILAEKNECMR